jgi:hypothetical protein
MDKDTRQEIVLHGVRWANNILAEVLSNHARHVSKEGADLLREAISILADAAEEFRKV